MEGESSAADAAKLRAELRRRKILQRGDERIKQIFGRSQDEETSADPLLPDKKTQNERLIEQIIKDHDTQREAVAVESSCTVQDASNTFVPKAGSADTSGLNSSFDVHSTTEATKPLIDASLFASYDKRQSLKQSDSRDLSRVQIFVLQLLHFYSTKSALLLRILIKLSAAILSSYHNYNIVVPFLFAHFTGLMYSNMSQSTETNWIKIAFQFVRGLFTEFPTFAFAYVLVQALKLS
jgi:hypothetical protein